MQQAEVLHVAIVQSEQRDGCPLESEIHFAGDIIHNHRFIRNEIQNQIRDTGRGQQTWFVPYTPWRMFQFANVLGLLVSGSWLDYRWCVGMR